MSENDTEIAVAAEVAVEMFTFRVLKREGTTNESQPKWVEVGEVECLYSYMGPSASEVGEPFGEGDYLLLHDGRFKQMTVEAEKYWREAEVEEAS